MLFRRTLVHCQPVLMVAKVDRRKKVAQRLKILLLPEFQDKQNLQEIAVICGARVWFLRVAGAEVASRYMPLLRLSGDSSTFSTDSTSICFIQRSKS